MDRNEWIKLFVDVLLISTLFLFVTLLVGCGNMEVKQIADPNIFYKRDMILDVNGRRGQGVVVAKPSNRYNIKISAFGQLDLLTYTTCHRDKDFIGLSGRDHEYEYVPVYGIEQTLNGSCPMVLGGYDKPNGRHSWGQIVFEDQNGVEAAIYCNAERYIGKTSICQNLEGQITLIEFKEKMKASPDCEYHLKEEDDGKRFTYSMPPRECVLTFCTKDGRCHDHFSVGYKQQLIRGK